MRMEIINRPQRPVPDADDLMRPRWGGRFFQEIIELPPGKYRARVQIMFSEFAENEPIRIAVQHLANQQFLDEKSVRADLQNREDSDHIYLSFALDNRALVEFSGRVSANCETTLLRRITVLDASPETDLSTGPRHKSPFHPSRCVQTNDNSSETSGLGAFRSAPGPEPSIRGFKKITFGTTGICNASCIHCPTNKVGFRQRTGSMDFVLFKKILAELRDGGFGGEIFFGLFAEPLEDRLLLDRIKLIKKLFPTLRISVATNLALFEPQKHSEIIDLIDHCSIHIEALTPEVYNRIMHPLKAERVFPKVNAAIRIARGKGEGRVSITTPVHRENLGEVSGLFNYFTAQGASVRFTSICSRAWEGGIYPKMALSPVGVACSPVVLTDETFIDWDGVVLPCCFDFSKSMPLGNLNNQTFEDVFASREWRELAETFRGGEWSSRPACSRCRVDQPKPVEKLVTSLTALVESRARHFPALKFRPTSQATRAPDNTITVEITAKDGCSVFGPYTRAESGKYRVHHEFRIREASARQA